MMPTYYEFYNPVKINAGTEALETIPYEMGMMGVSRPLVVTDPGIVRAGLLEHVLRGFRDSNLTIGAIYDQTPPDSSLEVVNEIARIYKETRCDCLVAVGGGSVIDTTKGVNIVVSEGTDDIASLTGADRLSKPQRPLIVVPTTSGTGSEVTQVAVISDTRNNVKLPFTSNLLMPRLAVLDPRMTMSLPPKITAATGMDAMTHAVEAYTCLQKNPLSDDYAVAAIGLLRDNLIETVKQGNDAKRRFALANASLMAGTAFSNSMVGAVHGIAHALGAVAHIPHGLANSILLPYVMRFNLDNPRMAELYGELLLPLAGDEAFARAAKRERPRKAIETIVLMNHALNKACGMPNKLGEAGVRREQFAQIVEKAMEDGAMISNPKMVNASDVLEILELAF